MRRPNNMHNRKRTLLDEFIDDIPVVAGIWFIGTLMLAIAWLAVGAI
jgi:hypothetical protein